MDNKVKELQTAQLKILEFFKSFCKKNKLRFFLAYGTCLGAVRHNGFIPWDDDVDLIMPAEDYCKLRELWPVNTTNQHFTLCDTTKDYVDHHVTLTIRDDLTTCILQADTESDTHHGIMIEIAPISACPASFFGRLWQSLSACVYGIFRAQRVPNSGGKVERMIVRGVLGVFHSSSIRYKIWKKAEKNLLRGVKDNTRFVRIFGQFHTLKRYYPISVFSEQAWLPFEDTTMPVPTDYDTYLKLLYRDYMTPPPEDKRVPCHNYLFYDVNRSYLEYKGEKYCKK